MSIRPGRRLPAPCAAVVLAALLLLFVTPVCAAPAVELIVNGGFESAGTGWSQSSARGNNLISGFFVYSGKAAADLAGNALNNDTDRLTQKITVPANVSARLQFWWALRTEEAGVAFDTLAIKVLNNSGGLLKTLATYDNTTLAPYTWEQASFDLSAYAGQTIQIQFEAKTDQGNPTEFFIDDVSVRTAGPMKRSFLPLIRR